MRGDSTHREGSIMRSCGLGPIFLRASAALISLWPTISVLTSLSGSVQRDKEVNEIVLVYDSNKGAVERL